MKKIKKAHVHIIAGAVLVALFGGLSFYTWQVRVQNNELVNQLTSEFVRIQDLEDLVVQKDEDLEAHKELIQNLRSQVDTSAAINSMVSLVTGATQTIEDIKKLEEADEMLLAKYSKVYFLNEHYVPENLTTIPSTYAYGGKEMQIKSEVLTKLAQMCTAMEEAGLAPSVLSAYRSFATQEALKSAYTVKYGSGANAFSADQGYSEHQLGTAVDFTAVALHGALDAFDTIPEYTWLTEHAHEYGFVLSYPHDNTYYMYEPWHWRFVGVALATALHEQGIYFYDMPQREINTYLLDMFE